MKFLKNFLGAFFLLACFLIPQSVSAEKTDWADKSYNFKAAKKVIIMNIQSNVDFGGRGNIFKQKLVSNYFDSVKKLKCQIYTEQDQAAADADLRVECTITNWTDRYYIEPEHTVWEEKPMYRRKRDSDGKSYEEKYYVTVPVTYPPRRVDVSDLSVSFEVYDMRTGKMVFGREDVRSRNDARAQEGMFGRICNSFFSDLNKKIK